ncbi:uncharacterized [Tachysurus ichikawai]
MRKQLINRKYLTNFRHIDLLSRKSGSRFSSSSYREHHETQRPTTALSMSHHKTDNLPTSDQKKSEEHPSEKPLCPPESPLILPRPDRFSPSRYKHLSRTSTRQEV